ncbi:hypothetical protein LR48_Vigan01g316400 [Vigna angularis]|uniref:DUF7963 domain-containing protein n=1 Tax=Phaseolus angularis TaxID=3914 RepID=A0A0L9TSN7_PHAAN|nr:hypothetical protein LR48_Vigan01g316400 [Vigna angularis]
MAQKRYEGLLMVRNKAIKGKGAWYWTHLEPLLAHNTETGLPKAVKLRYTLCDVVFSASNPSRTASEHLKRDMCPNFNSAAKPISSVSPVVVPSSSPSSASPFLAQHNHRKRTTTSPSASGSLYHAPSRFGSALVPQQPHLVMSGGKEDLGALAMLEDSVKKLKSPKTSPGPALSKAQIDSAIEFLGDWVYESCGSVSFASLEHPKFRAFLSQVGLSAVFSRELTGARLEARFEGASTLPTTPTKTTTACSLSTSTSIKT